MQQSSESVAALAAALAKAQARLVNPEKSLTASIRTGRMGESERTFRYAPLSSGLEIVRKTLSEHEIAVIQTTALDPSSRILNLTTPTPRANGSARSGRFALSPISRAPTGWALPSPTFGAMPFSHWSALRGKMIWMRRISALLHQPRIPRKLKARAHGTHRGTAEAAEGAKSRPPHYCRPSNQLSLRDRLVKEIAGLESQDSAAEWARAALARKNTLTAGDARLVETAFALKQSAFSLTHVTKVSRQDAVDTPPAVHAPLGSNPAPAAERLETGGDAEEHPAQAGRIDKSVLTLSAPRRYLNKEHLRFVAQQPCLLCARKPSDPHHLRFVQPRALGRKSSDEYAVPLCRAHHRAVHRARDEAGWWKAAGIDPTKIARKLWKDTRANTGALPSSGSAERPNVSLNGR
jgi:hypothetical protein